MSFFYASPVEGEMHLHDLENAVKDRIEFLKSLVSGGQLKYSEYLLEGSPYDNAGHFTLYIIESLSKNPELSNLIRTGEIKLFERRLTYLNPDSLQIFAKKILRYVKRNIFTYRYSEALNLLCSKMSIMRIAQHLCNNHSEYCCRHEVSINFTLCLPYVSTRKVKLKQGKAILPCGLWMQYLILLYKMHLAARDEQIREQLGVFRNDNRIMSIAAQYATYGKEEDSDSASNCNYLLSGEVDTQSQFFPPCMKNLLNKLRKHHRLSHDQRFYFTCFLKDIGMPVSEAIKFWKEEYSKSSCRTFCQHTWAANGAKYIQSIRHTYGLEGSRTSYSCAGCTKIQSNSCARAEGGCPFKDFSEENMINVLSPEFVTSNELERIKAYRSQGCYSKACKYYLETAFPSSHRNIDCNSETMQFFLSPVKFFTKAINLTNPESS